MESKPYLIFSLHDVQYGIDANLVKEIFLLPELTPIAEAPIDIVGILNLRGRVLPIMHLDLRLGNSLQECHISDSVIVVAWEGLQIGAIVNFVYEVKNIDSNLIETKIDYGRIREINPAFVAGIAKIDADIIILLNPEGLIRQPDAVDDLIVKANKEQRGKEAEGQRSRGEINTESLNLSQENGTVVGSEALEDNTIPETARIISNFYDLCCPNATPKERVVFRQRADNLRQAITEEDSDVTGKIPIAVVSLNGEYFGIDLDVVREFTNVRNLTPIPCCPNHIVGNMNLRGEIVTLVDIRNTLNLPIAPVKTGSKAVVIDVDEVVAGLPVEEVFDVMYLHPLEMTTVPIAANSGSDAYLRGTAPYAEKMLSVLDLPKILTKSGLAVDEET
jgi:purine-binding chemotaxis protein CheW